MSSPPESAQTASRNVGGWWGRYHAAEIAVDVAPPAGEIEVNRRWFPSYRDPTLGVRLEPDEVGRIASVYPHCAEYTRSVFVTPSWERLRRQHDDVISHTTAPTLSGGPAFPRPIWTTGQTDTPEEDAPRSGILCALSAEQYDTIVLSDMLALWSLDLKHWFPGLQVHVSPTLQEHTALGLELSLPVEGIQEDEK